jgi:RNA-binding protein Musashi
MSLLDFLLGQIHITSELTHLNFKVSKSRLEFGDYFSMFGPVKDAVVMVDRATGSSRGFGFVTFEQVDTVEKVMKASHELKGKFVEIKRAQPRDMRYVLK